MKRKEFEEIKDELVDGLDVVIRYFTYNKNHYIDILGTINNIYGFSVDMTARRYSFSILFYDIINYAGDFNENTYPNLDIFSFQDKDYYNLYSDKIIWIRKSCLRSYKLKKLKENIEYG